MFSTKKRGRNKERVGEEIRNFGQNIYPRRNRDKQWGRNEKQRQRSEKSSEMVGGMCKHATGQEKSVPELVYKIYRNIY